MRRLLVLGLLVLAGCRGVQGPMAPKEPVRVDDPRLPISEQEKRARERLALPLNSPGVAPSAEMAPPGTPLFR